MKISYQWLKEFLPGLKVAPKVLADRLTQIGLEVEGVEELGKGLKQVVVGHVLKVDRHPNADRLSLCEVTDGRQSYPIVCGAPNVTAGKKYPLALIGTILPNGLEIKQAAIRGVESFGMLCSAKELGLEGENSGILELGPDAPVGQSFGDYYGLNDTILDVAIPPNRGDCLSHKGLARELSALFSLTVQEQKVKYLQGTYLIKDYVKVKVQDRHGCLRYCSRVIRNVQIGPSPLWLKRRLENLGIRPINNVVDATNYVMLETGHPLHAFDHRFIRQGTLLVSKGGKPQTFETLDHEKRELVPDDLVIADGEGPIALAGIIGGKNSEVRDDTTLLVLEAAAFDAIQIRRISRRLGVQTESSYRFERGVDAESVRLALDRLTELILALSGGEPSRDSVDIYPKKIKPLRISLKHDELRRVLGAEIKPVIVKKILGNLGFKPSPVSGGFKLSIPTNRSDIIREIDVIEEVIRFYGYDNIPSALPVMSVRQPIPSVERPLEALIRDLLVARGFYETIHLSFCDTRDLEMFGWQDPLLSLANPLSQEMAILRPTLLPALLKTYRRNQMVRDAGLRLFEIRPVFFPPHGEKKRLAALYGGDLFPKNWLKVSRVMDFFDGKGFLEALFKKGGVTDCRFVATSNCPEYHPGLCVAIQIGDNVLGHFGRVHPTILTRFEIDEAVYAFDIDFSLLARLWKENSKSFVPLSSFPQVVRDVALVMDQSLSHDQIVEAIRESEVPWLKSVSLFDSYQGEKLPAGKKSLAFSLVYESAAKTLTDEEVNRVHFTLVDTLSKKLGVELR